MSHLRELAASGGLDDFGAPQNWVANAAVRHTLQTAIEALIDVAYHVAAKRLKAAPTDGYHAFSLLVGAGCIPPPLLPTVRRMVGFRNRIVHRYIDIEDAEVLHIVLQDLGDFETVLQALETAVRSTPSSL